MLVLHLRPVLPVVLVSLLVMTAVGVTMAADAKAHMVIAPSKIVVSSNGNTENYKSNNDSDNTVKAIIWYPLALNDGERVDEDPSDMGMTILAENEEGVSIDASILRYCYVDDNLIVEFDREEVVKQLMDRGLVGPVEVNVFGSFNVVDENDNVIANYIVEEEKATLLVSNPQFAK